MGNDASVIIATGTGTTTLNGCYLYNLCINKTLAGTVDLKENGTSVAQFAIGTTPGNYHTHPGGARYYKLTVVLSAGDNVSILSKSTAN